MGRTTRHLLTAAAILLAAGLALADDGERDKPEEVGKCVKATAEARYSGYGYDHLVHLSNTCKEDMRCTVTTSANKRGVKVEVAKNERETVVTFRGSPAREFDMEVECAPK